MHDIDAHAFDEPRYEDHRARLSELMDEWREDVMGAYDDCDPKSPDHFDRFVDMWDLREKCQ